MVTDPALMDEVASTERASWIFRAPGWVHAAIVVAVGFVKYGADIYPAWYWGRDLALTWHDPHRLLKGPADLILSSPVSAWIAGIIGATSERAFLGFHLVLAIGAVVSVYAMPRVRRSAELRAMITLLLVGGAILPVLFDWVGSYDPVSVLAITVAVLAINPYVAGLGWALLAFNHGPLALLSLVIVAAVMIVEGSDRLLLRCVTAISGVLGGLVAIRIVTDAWGGSTSRLQWYREIPHSYFYDTLLNYWPLILFSALGVGWFVLFELRRRPGALAVMIAALLASIALPFVVQDESRIVSLSVWPAVLWFAAAVVPTLDVGEARALITRWALPAVVVPVVLVWTGALVYPGWQSWWSFVVLLSGGK